MPAARGTVAGFRFGSIARPGSTRPWGSPELRAGRNGQEAVTVEGLLGRRPGRGRGVTNTHPPRGGGRWQMTVGHRSVRGPSSIHSRSVVRMVVGMLVGPTRCFQ